MPPARRPTVGHLAQTHQEADGRRDRVGHEVRGAARLREALGGLGDVGQARLLAPERLDDGAPGVRLLNAPGELTERGLARGRQLERARGHDLGRNGREQREHDKDAREHEVVGRHHDDGAADHGDGDQQLEKTALQHLGHLVEVVGRTADGVAGLVRVVVGQRQARALLGDPLAKAQIQALGEARHDEHLHGVEEPRRGPDAEKHEDLLAAVSDRGDEGLALREGGLDVGPEQVDEVRAVRRRPERAGNVGNGAERRDDEPPALAARRAPEASRRAEGVRGDLEVSLRRSGLAAPELGGVVELTVLLATHWRSLPSSASPRSPCRWDSSPSARRGVPGPRPRRP